MIKNTASQKVGAQMVSATDGSAFTGSVTVAVTGDAGTQATGSVGSGACVHEGNGYHTYAPAQAETNYDLIGFTFTGTGAVPQTVQVYTTTTPAAGLDAAGVRAALGLASANLDTQLAAIFGLIDTEIGALITAIAALPTTAQIADKVLGRSHEGGADGGRTVTQCLQAIRNKVVDATGLLTVYASDDTTPSWTAATTRDGAAGALTAVDPA